MCIFSIIKNFFDEKVKSNSRFDLVKIDRSFHNISRKSIPDNVLYILYKLKRNGYDAYLVGGCIRDMLLSKSPKDFDITTNATPDQMLSIFNHARKIGRRFKIVHVMFGRDFVEVATLRTSPKVSDIHKKSNGIVVCDNYYASSVQEDSVRRDFTLNSIFYNIKDFSLLCSKQAIEDFLNKQIRIIGDPYLRYKEDPVRMVRAVRFSSKLNMDIEQLTLEPIDKLAPTLLQVHPSRIYEESSKLFFSGFAKTNFVKIKKFGLLKYILPDICSAGKYQQQQEVMIPAILDKADALVSTNNRVSHSYFYSNMFWFVIINSAEDLLQNNSKVTNIFQALSVAVNLFFDNIKDIILFRRRLIFIINIIYQLQIRIANAKKNKYASIKSNEYFDKAMLLIESRILAGDSSAFAARDHWLSLCKSKNKKSTKKS